MQLVLFMAFITAMLRYTGFFVAYSMARFPRFQKALAVSGPCLMMAYLAIQAEQNPMLIFPIGAAMAVSWVSKGVFPALLAGWGLYLFLG